MKASFSVCHTCVILKDWEKRQSVQNGGAAATALLALPFSGRSFLHDSSVEPYEGVMSWPFSCVVVTVPRKTGICLHTLRSHLNGGKMYVGYVWHVVCVFCVFNGVKP